MASSESPGGSPVLGVLTNFGSGRGRTIVTAGAVEEVLHNLVGGCS
jgi:hypothetical protein